MMNISGLLEKLGNRTFEGQVVWETYRIGGDLFSDYGAECTDPD